MQKERQRETVTEQSLPRNIVLKPEETAERKAASSRIRKAIADK